MYFATLYQWPLSFTLWDLQGSREGGEKGEDGDKSDSQAAGGIEERRVLFVTIACIIGSKSSRFVRPPLNRKSEKTFSWNDLQSISDMIAIQFGFTVRYIT